MNSDKELRNNEERMIIDYFSRYGVHRMYNRSCKSGGVAKHSDETKEKCREASRNMWKSSDYRKKRHPRSKSKEERQAWGKFIRSVLLGKKRSDSARKSISEGQKKNSTPERRLANSLRRKEFFRLKALFDPDWLKEYAQKLKSGKERAQAKREQDLQLQLGDKKNELP